MNETINQAAEVVQETAEAVAKTAPLSKLKSIAGTVYNKFTSMEVNVSGKQVVVVAAVVATTYGVYRIGKYIGNKRAAKKAQA